MIAALAATFALALSASMPLQQTDTTFAVRAGGTLELEAHTGSVVIDTWDRDAMRVLVSGSGRTRVRIRQRSDGVEIETGSRGMGESLEYRVTVPRRYDVDVEGVNLTVSVSGLTGAVRIENVEGGITVRGIDGEIDVESVSGAIQIANTRGRISASTVNQAIRMQDVRGDVEAETVNGSLIIRNADSGHVQASTVNGLVEYMGTVRDGGKYYLGTHNGRITMGLPVGTNAEVSARTNSGTVESAFSVPVGSSGERSIRFTLGSGSARVELESYNGTVNLVRPAGR